MENKEKCVLAEELGLDNNVSEYAKEIRKSYYKDWRQKNKDKVKSYNSKYWEKRANKLRQNQNN